MIANHSSAPTNELLQKIKQPVMINGSDNDHAISHERLTEIEDLLKGKSDLPSDVKARRCIVHLKPSTSLLRGAVAVSLGKQILHCHQSTFQENAILNQETYYHAIHNANAMTALWLVVKSQRCSL